MEEEKCVFIRPDGTCGALHGTHCYGNNTKCHFYKTEEKFIADRNRAIEINRAKGNCDHCKYCITKCELSPRRKNNVF